MTADLIARLEEATKGSRQLDEQIWCAANDVEWPDAVSPSSTMGRIHREDVPHYTTSIDAALTLVSAKSLWSVCDMEDGPIAQVLPPLPDGRFGEVVSGEARTPPLALCIAALRAHEAERG